MHGAGLMQNVRTNLKQLHSYYRGKTKINSSAKPVKTEYDFPKVSKEELEKIKIDIKKKIKKEKQKGFLITLTATIIFFGILIYSLYKII